MSSSLPLRFRLPNPPPTFRGRGREVQWLTNALARAPIAAVWGPSGLGKSALVHHVVNEHFISKARPVIRVLLLPDGEPLGLQLLSALASATPTAFVRWSEVGGAHEASVGRLIELAEKDSWCIVVDDAHHAEPDALRHLFVDVAKYARDSQWVVAGQTELRVPELSAQVIGITPMADDAIGLLAADLAPSKTVSEIGEAVEIAQGSPWRLQQYLVGGTQALRTATELLSHLNPGQQRLVRAMLFCERPLPERVFGKLVESEPADRAYLVEAGFAERIGESLALHDSVRVILGDATSLSLDEQQSMSELLCSDDDPVVALEGLGLALTLDQGDRVAATLERHGEHWLRHFAPRLSVLISAVASVSAYWRLRCALAMGDVDALSAMTSPSKPEVSYALLWCEAKLVCGELQRAAELANEIRNSSESAAETCFAAGLLEARAIMNLGRFVDALVIIADLRPATTEQSVQKVACEAVCHTATENTELAVRALTQVETELANAPAKLKRELRRELRHRVAQSYYHLGRLHDASRSIKGQPSVTEPPILFENRSTQLLSATIDLERGELREAYAAANRLRAFSGTGSLLEPYLDYHEITHAMAAGNLAELAQTIDDVQSRAIARKDGSTAQLARAFRETLWLIRAEPMASESVPVAVPVPPVMDRLFTLCHARRQIRQRQTNAAPDVKADEHVELALLQTLAAAEASFLRGAEREAIALARRAVSTASANGYGIREVEARHLLCELLATSRPPSGDKQLENEVAALKLLAQRMDSERFVLEAELFGHLCAAEIDLGLIERLAALIDVAPVAARRARALLGAEVPLDAIDQRVLGAFHRHADWGSMTTTSSLRTSHGSADGSAERSATDWVKGWGIDKRRRTGWLPDGTSLDFSTSPILWRLIETLVEQDGPCCKETLAKTVWGESEYHPLRHDNRLHAAIRKLRRLVEDAPAKPERIVTDEKGYCVSGSVRVVKQCEAI